MRIAVVSLFRNNSQQYIQRYFSRTNSLRCEIAVTVFAAEGDSTDDTLNYLDKEKGAWDQVTHIYTGIKQYGSIVYPERFKCLSDTANVGLDAVAAMKGFDKVVFIDSDLIYAPDLMRRLLKHQGKDVIAPLVMAGKAFYDIWGFRKLDGECFPSFADWMVDIYEPFEVSSVGGVVMMDARAVYDGVRFGEGAIVSLCANLREYGYHIWVDPKTVVFHPVPGGNLTYEGNLLQFNLPYSEKQSKIA